MIDLIFALSFFVVGLIMGIWGKGVLEAYKKFFNDKESNER